MDIKNQEQEKISILLEDLSALEDYIKDLFSFLPLPICFISPIDIILEVNPAFEELSGYKAEEIVGESIEKIFDLKESMLLTKEVFRKKSIKNKEIFFYDKKQEKIPIGLSATLRKNKEKETIGYFIGLFDLSKVKKKEQDLQQELKKNEEIRKALINILEDVDEEKKKSEQEKNKTLAIITNFSDGLLFFDDKNNLLLINPEAEKIFNVKKEEVVGKSSLELVKVFSLKGLINLIGIKFKKVFREELAIKENLVLEISTALIVADKYRVGTLVILHNITREKLIEKIKTEFVSVAAHQLRTPLSAIKWTLRMLLDGDLGEITKEQRNFIEKTYNSNERMVSLINDLLDVTKIEEGRYLYKKTLASIEDSVLLNISSFQDILNRKNIKIIYKKPEKNLPKIKMDVEKINLSIHNFIDNAIKYTNKQGEIKIMLEHDEKNKQIIFSIKDSGVGIPLDQQNRLFSKFFRGANVIRMETEGSGLGLFIVKNIIEAHGGRVWFNSEEGKGTEFFFSLPLQEKLNESLKEF